MKKTPSKILIISSLFALLCAFAAPAVRAEDSGEKDKAAEKAAKKAKHEAEILAKYDLNKDGKLDDAEKAALKADEDKAKAEHKAKAGHKKEAGAAKEKE